MVQKAEDDGPPCRPASAWPVAEGVESPLPPGASGYVTRHSIRGPAREQTRYRFRADAMIRDRGGVSSGAIVASDELRQRTGHRTGRQPRLLH